MLTAELCRVDSESDRGYSFVLTPVLFYVLGGTRFRAMERRASGATEKCWVAGTQTSDMRLGEEALGAVPSQYRNRQLFPS